MTEGDFHALMIAYIALFGSVLLFDSPFAPSAGSTTARDHDRNFRLSAATGGVMLIPPVLNWVLFIGGPTLEPDRSGPNASDSTFFWWWLVAITSGFAGMTFANVARGSAGGGMIGNVGFVAGAVGGVLGDLLLNPGKQHIWALAEKLILAGAALGGEFSQILSEIRALTAPS